MWLSSILAHKDLTNPDLMGVMLRKSVAFNFTTKLPSAVQ